jgi:hypothetical protein
MTLAPTGRTDLCEGARQRTGGELELEEVHQYMQELMIRVRTAIHSYEAAHLNLLIIYIVLASQLCAHGPPLE